MRVLCVGRHAFLSEHFCRVFSEANAECEPVVGATDALRKAAEFEPHVVVCDCDLMTPTLLESWASEPTLAHVPVLAVSLTRRPDDSLTADLCGPAAVIYLPALKTDQIAALLRGLPRPRGVPTPPSWPSHAPARSVHTG
jgi:chemotaxis response regulator CheB